MQTATYMYYRNGEWVRHPCRVLAETAKSWRITLDCTLWRGSKPIEAGEQFRVRKADTRAKVEATR